MVTGSSRLQGGGVKINFQLENVIWNDDSNNFLTSNNVFAKADAVDIFKVMINTTDNYIKTNRIEVVRVISANGEAES